MSICEIHAASEQIHEELSSVYQLGSNATKNMELSIDLEILTEIIFVISAAIIVLLKAKTMFIIKDEVNVNKFNFKKEFCGIGFIMFMVYWIISCVDAIAY